MRPAFFALVGLGWDNIHRNNYASNSSFLRTTNGSYIVVDEHPGRLQNINLLLGVRAKFSGAQASVQTCPHGPP